jgi:hypothetical protein
MYFNPARLVKGRLLGETVTGVDNKRKCYLFRLQKSEQLLIIQADANTNEVVSYFKYETDYDFVIDCLENPEGVAAGLFKAQKEWLSSLTIVSNDNSYVLFE